MVFKVLDVHSQHLVHELVRAWSRTQTPRETILDDRARAIVDDGVPASLQRK